MHSLAPAQNPVTVVKNHVGAYQQNTATPLISVALYADGNGYTLGFPDDETVPPDLIFSLGSVTKAFTATMLAYQCVGSSPAKHLDDPVVSYLPPAVGAQGQAIKDVLLWHLATHTASFPRQIANQTTAGRLLFSDQAPGPGQIEWWTAWNNPPSAPAAAPDAPQAGSANPCAGQPPGTCWEYSNWGFVTLGYAVVNCRVGPPPGYNDLLAEYITGPLGMTHTLTHVPANWPIAPPSDPRAKIPPDLKSNAADMLVFIKASLGIGSALPEQLGQAIALTHAPCWQGPIGQTRNDMTIGLAWQLPVVPANTPQILVKNGAGGGYSCFIGLVPARQLGIMILTNKIVGKSGRGPIRNPTQLGRAILGQLIQNTTGSPTPPPEAAIMKDGTHTAEAE